MCMLQNAKLLKIITQLRWRPASFLRRFSLARRFWNHTWTTRMSSPVSVLSLDDKVVTWWIPKTANYRLTDVTRRFRRLLVRLLQHIQLLGGDRRSRTLHITIAVHFRIYKRNIHQDRRLAGQNGVINNIVVAIGACMRFCVRFDLYWTYGLYTARCWLTPINTRQDGLVNQTQYVQVDLNYMSHPWISTQ